MPAIDDIVKASRTKPRSILESLLAVQKAIGHVPPSAISEIAHVLEVTEAEVAGVLSYYPDLHTRPCGRHLVRICMGESCVANHSQRLLAAIRKQLGVGVGETTADGEFTVEQVYCVGNCAVGPSLMVDGDVVGRVTPHNVAALLEGPSGVRR